MRLGILFFNTNFKKWPLKPIKLLQYLARLFPDYLFRVCSYFYWENVQIFLGCELEQIVRSENLRRNGGPTQKCSFLVTSFFFSILFLKGRFFNSFHLTLFMKRRSLIAFLVFVFQAFCYVLSPSLLTSVLSLGLS